MSHQLWDYYRGYAFWRPYVDACTRWCFSSVRIEGLENMPRDGHVILAPNHRQTLMDALLILLLDKGPIAFGARADIFAKPRIAAILRWLRIVPIARERNGLREVAKNFAVFDEIVECLGHGVPFCLFPEGQHRPQKGLLPIKKGIFKLADLAAERLDGPVYVVPVGIDSEFFFRGMGRVVLRVGKPIRPADYEEGPDRFSRLSQDLTDGLQALIDQPFPPHKLPKPVVWLAFPLWLVCAVLGLPIWLGWRWVLRGMKDKAWMHTVRFGFRLLLPVFQPFEGFFEGWLTRLFSVRN